MHPRVAALFLLCLAGCTSFHLLKPLNPGVGNPNKDPDEVTSLRPTLSWGPSADTGVTYDLIIYEGIKEESFWEGTKRRAGDMVYYREAIAGTECTVDTTLKPGTEYYWSVRVRKGPEVSAWSRYDYTLFLVFSYVKVSDAFFRFRTPEENP